MAQSYSSYYSPNLIIDLSVRILMSSTSEDDIIFDSETNEESTKFIQSKAEQPNQHIFITRRGRKKSKKNMK